MVRDTSRLLIAGASNQTGRQVLAFLSDYEIEVQAITQSKSNRSDLRNRGADRVIAGDLRDPSDARAAVEECDGVLSVVGSKLSFKNIFKRQHIAEQKTVNLIDAADRAGISRFILASSIGVGNSQSGIGLSRQVAFSRILAAKERAEQHLRTAETPHNRPHRQTHGRSWNW